MNMDKNKNEGAELPKFLEKLKEENPFIVPHNYFRELPDEILGQIKKEEMAASAKLSWSARLKTYLQLLLLPRPVLAIVTVALLIGGLFWWSQNQPETLLATADFDQEEILSYIQQNLDEFNESDFYTDDAAAADLLQESFDDDDLIPLLEELIDEVDVETLEDIL